MRLSNYLIVALVLCALASPAQATLVSFQVDGLMDGGGPGFRYDLSTTENAKDYDPTFSFILTYDTAQAATGSYDFTFGQFTINTSSDASSNADYVGTLNSSYTQTITVDGGADTFELLLDPSPIASGTVAAAPWLRRGSQAMRCSATTWF